MKDIKDIRILYMGTPEISAKTLEDLISYGYNIVGVIAQCDKEVGRKHLLEKVPTKVVAELHNIPVYQVERIRDNYEFVKEINPDLILTFSYGQIIPKGLIDIPKYGCLNLHGSLLPKYRGAAPIQRAIMDGETETGITLMEMVEAMDAGKMYATVKVKISEDMNYTLLCDLLARAATKCALEYLPKYINGELPGIEQDESQVTIAKKIKPEEEKLSFDLSVAEFINKVRALSFTPGAYLYLDNLKLKIFEAEVTNLPLRNLGELIIQKGVYLSLKDKVIHIKKLQLEGKKMMDDKSFANGAQKYNGYILK